VLSIRVFFEGLGTRIIVDNLLSGIIVVVRFKCRLLSCEPTIGSIEGEALL